MLHLLRLPLIRELLAGYRPQQDAEKEDLAAVREMIREVKDPWTQAIPLHITASALVVHPPTRRVLLRWHARQRAWLQIGGHGDPGETDALSIALREGVEETGLRDLRPWPNGNLIHVVIVPVAGKGDSPPHRHADLRFVLATDDPDGVVPERDDAQLRWLTLAGATALTSEVNLRETLSRAARLLGETP